MRRPRLLIVLPAVGALVLTGPAPASADPAHDDGKLSARVLDIDATARANDKGTRVTVEFDYTCTGDDDDIRTRVVLRQDGDRFMESFKGHLRCDGVRHAKKVELRGGKGARLERGDARVTVRFVNHLDGKVLRELKERGIDVQGVHEHRGGGRGVLSG